MKTYVIALTTYREIIRRPLVWLLVIIATFTLILFDFIPYYTFGEDIKMVKDQGLTLIMVVGLTIAMFSASVSIADEIDGKTAITLLSKPINRREFILGKFLGILAAIAVVFVILSVIFLGCLVYKALYDAKEGAVTESDQDYPSPARLVQLVVDMLPGLALTYLQIMVICSISVALSTRLPLFLNIIACFFVFFVGHIAPQLVQAGSQNQFEGVQFMAKFFATILPGLEYFNVGPAISTDTPVPWIGYVLPCFVYAIVYSTISVLFAFLMFEDRDLA